MSQHVIGNTIGEFLITVTLGFRKFHFALGHVAGDFGSGNESHTYHAPVNIYYNAGECIRFRLARNFATDTMYQSKNWKSYADRISKPFAAM